MNDLATKILDTVFPNSKYWGSEREAAISRIAKVLRDEPREIICSKCSLREQQGEIPKGDF